MKDIKNINQNVYSSNSSASLAYSSKIIPNSDVFSMAILKNSSFPSIFILLKNLSSASALFKISVTPSRIFVDNELKALARQGMLSIEDVSVSDLEELVLQPDTNQSALPLLQMI